MILKRKAQVPKVPLQARIQPGTFNAEKRTVDVCVSTGAVGKRWDWSSWQPYMEELQVDEQSVRLGRLEAGAAVLNSHQAHDLEHQFGVTERGWIEGGMVYATIRFSDREDVAGIVRDIQNGIIRNVSVGYIVHRYQDVTLPDAKMKTLRAVDWEPAEVSFVAVPFDAGAQVRAAEKDTSKMPQLFEAEIIENARAASQTHKERAMDPKELAEQQARELAEKQARELADKQAKEAAEKAAAQAKATERQRQIEIREAAATLGLRALGEEHCGKDTTADEFRVLALRAKAKQDESTDTNGKGTQVVVTRDEKQTRAEGMADVLLHRSNPVAYPMTEKGRSYNGMSILRMAEEIVGGRGLSKSEIAQRALSSSDFPLLAESTVARTLRADYKLAPRTFQPFVRFGQLPDYRETKRVNFGAASSLSHVPEGGEYTEGTVGEKGEAISLLKYGKIIAITEETIINDNLDAFTRLPGRMGAAAARLESKLVYDMLLANPDMADEVALFHATHGNLGTTGVPSETTLDEMRELMRAQMDGDDYLDVMPEFIIVGPAIETATQKLLSAVLAATTSNVNVFAGSLKMIVEPRVTGSKWFAAANPTMIDTIEVAYLDGMNGPQITRDESFKTDGIAFKVKHVVGVKAIDWKGLFYNAGS